MIALFPPIPQPPATLLRSRRPGRWLALVLIAVAAATSSCRQNGAETKPADVDYYTCSMHPSVRKQNPKDKCPICGMDLIPVKKKTVPGTTAAAHSHEGAAGQGPSAAAQPTNAPPETPGEFTVPAARQQLIGVTYATIQKRPIHRVIRAVGIVASDKQRHWDFVSRVDGYVQTLEVSSRGEKVEKDQPLLTLFSPDLLTTQNELVELLKMRDSAKESGAEAALETAGRLIASAKRRLQLWNISTAQIDELEKSRTARETLTLHSPFKGIIKDLPVDLGRRVMAGDHLVDVTDLSTVWVWVDFYQEELPLLKKGLPAKVTSASYPGETFGGVVDLIDPFINDAKRTGRVRLTLPNPDLKLQPDMYVDIELSIDLGEAVTVPVNAIMPTGKHAVVFLDKGEGRLEPRFIQLGGRYGDDYAVLSGLKETERVVSSANFLIDAEAKVQGALKSW